MSTHPFQLIKRKCEQVFKARYHIYDDDVIYDSMLSICLQYQRSQKKIKSFNAWLNGAIHHHFCAFLEKQERLKIELDDVHNFPIEDTMIDEISQLQKDEIYNEIRKLSSPAKEILEMKIYNEFGYKEISERMKMKESAIRKVVSRAIQKISKNLTYHVTIYLFCILSGLEGQLWSI